MTILDVGNVSDKLTMSDVVQYGLILSLLLAIMLVYDRARNYFKKMAMFNGVQEVRATSEDKCEPRTVIMFH